MASTPVYDLASQDPASPPSESEALRPLAQLQRLNDRRFDPQAFEHCDPWFVEEPCSTELEQRLLDLDGLQQQNSERLQDTSSRLRHAIASGRQRRVFQTTVSGGHAVAESGSASAGCSTPGNPQPARPKTAPPPRSRRRRSGEEEADSRARALENRVRANNWISETCPAEHGDDLRRPWVIHHNAVMREKRMQGEVMKNIAKRGWCPFEDWLHRREESERHNSLANRLRLAARMSNLQSETQRELVTGLKTLFAKEGKEAVSRQNTFVQEMEKTSHEAPALLTKKNNFSQDEFKTAIRLVELSGVGERDIQEAKNSQFAEMRLRRATMVAPDRSGIQSALQNRRAALG